jgi:hypothetical protein
VVAKQREGRKIYLSIYEGPLSRVIDAQPINWNYIQ